MKKDTSDSSKDEIYSEEIFRKAAEYLRRFQNAKTEEERTAIRKEIDSEPR